MALRISDLGTAPTVEETDLVEIAEVDGESPSGYSSYKTTILGIANKIATSTVFSGLVTTAKNIVGSINEVNGLLDLKESKADMEEDVAEILEDLSDDVTVTGNPVTFETINGGMAKSCEVTMLPIQSGTGDPSPTNIRPISGWDGLNLTRTGKNLFDKTATDSTKGYSNNKYLWLDGGERNSNDWYISEYIRIGTSLSISGLPTSDATNPAYCLYTKDKTFIRGAAYRNREKVEDITISSDAYYLRISVPKSNVDSIQVETNITATAYEPYNGETHTHQYSETIYGGTDDFVSGDGSSNRNIVDLGTLDWTKSTEGDYVIFALASAITGKRNNDKCECYKPVNKSRQNLNDGEIGLWNTVNSYHFVVRDDSKANMTAEEFKASVTGYKATYYIATPTTFSTEPTPIELLKGTNVVSTDGDEIKLVASKLANVPDLLTYIQSLEARIKALEEA